MSALLHRIDGMVFVRLVADTLSSKAWFTLAALEAPTGSESVICSTSSTGQ